MASIRSIDLNADLGEHDGDGFARDDAILDVVSSASVACGGHAGSPTVVRATIASAHAKGVVIGAHPGFPDRDGFGRRDSTLSVRDIGSTVADQIALLRDSCTTEGARLLYVKPHGALYNRSVADVELANELVERIRDIDDSLIVLTLPKSALGETAKQAGLCVAREAFIDRAYMSNGTLVPRTREGAVIHDPRQAATRAVTMVRSQRVSTIDGVDIEIDAESFCVHGDSVNALETVSEARRQLEEAGFSIAPFAK